MGALTRAMIRRKWEENRRRDTWRLERQPRPAGVEVMEGLPYLPDGNPMHTLNLYRPSGVEGSLPTVVDIHGGGWMYGDRMLNRNYCMALAAQGYGVMGMSYRLLPQTDLRGQIQDVFASLRWLEDCGAEYGLDAGRLLLTGDSAGGHLAGLAACIQESPALQALYGVRPLARAPAALAIVHGVCDVYRFSFLRAPFDQAVSREYQKLLFGPRWRLSPLYGHASFADTAPGLDLPPILVVASEPDRYYAQSRQLMEFLDRRSLEHQVILWRREQGAHLTHVFEVSHWDWPESQETNRRMLDFFDQAVRRTCQGKAPEKENPLL